jgi:hypothetical protein
MITLPAFELLKKQPDAPHVAHVVVKNDVANEHGALITYRVEQSRNGKSWWISASREGLRMSNTLHTTVAAKAQAWIAAVKAGTIRVGSDEVTLTCDMVKTCQAPVTYIDEKGFVYCTGHGQDRQSYRRCRKLRPHEIKTLRSGQPIARY